MISTCKQNDADTEKALAREREGKAGASQPLNSTPRQHPNHPTPRGTSHFLFASPSPESIPSCPTHSASEGEDALERWRSGVELEDSPRSYRPTSVRRRSSSTANLSTIIDRARLDPCPSGGGIVPLLAQDMISSVSPAKHPPTP